MLWYQRIILWLSQKVTKNKRQFNDWVGRHWPPIEGGFKSECWKVKSLRLELKSVTNFGSFSIFKAKISYIYILRYSSVWKLLLQNHSCYIPSESSRHQEAMGAMDQNTLYTLQLVWSVTSEQVKIKSNFFLLGTWYYTLMWLETQSTVKKKVVIKFSECAFFAHFSKNCLFINCLSGCIDG